MNNTGNRILLVRYSEIHLKGLNRPFFEGKLIENIKKAVKVFNARVLREQGRIYVAGLDEQNIEEATEKVKKVFGVHSVSPAVETESKEWNDICENAKLLVEKTVANKLNGREKISFKVFAKRADKRFPMQSDVIGRELGHYLLENIPEIYVDVHEPEIKVGIEIREKVYMYTDEIKGVGGMPTGSSGRAALLISGGIDSPVAGYMMAKRGLELSAVHFYSYPYTSERARDKVVDLAKIVAEYSGPIKLHLVPFTDIQLAIYEKCPSKETTVIMRRLMMKIAQMIAEKDGALALITGEALGQVASQTLESLCVTNDAVTMPVFRPLIGFDKDDIMLIARQIGTYETSILPYEDCCTVFVPQHPVTKPKVEDLRASEQLVDFTEMINKAIEDTQVVFVG